MSFGGNVRKLRMQQGLTQERLADRVSLSSDYLSRLELGKENPTIDVLHRLSSALGVGISSLFDHNTSAYERLRRVYVANTPSSCSYLIPRVSVLHIYYDSCTRCNTC